MKYWLCLTNTENWRIIKKNDLYGFNEQNKKYIDIIKKDDKIIMYVIPKRIGGLFEIISKYHDQNSKLLKEYPYKVKIKKIKVPKDFIEVNDKIISNLKMFDNSIRWGTILMGRSIKELDKEDFEYLTGVIDNA